MKSTKQKKSDITNIVDMLLGIILLMMMLLICIEVVGRKFFNYSTLVADEYSGYGLAVITFLGLAGTMKAGIHINVNFVYVRLSERLKIYADLAAHLVAILYVSLITWYLIDRQIYLFTSKTTSISYSKTLLYLPHFAMPIGGILLLYCLLKRTAAITTKLK